MFADTYSVTVTDALFCTATGNVVIGQPDELTLDIVRISMIRNATNDPADLPYVYLPVSSINNAEISYGFTGSALNASNHRQFEIKIPKSELEHYNSINELGIIVGGYGTLNFPGKDYWVYSSDINTIPVTYYKLKI